MSHPRSSMEAAYLHHQQATEPSKTAYNKLVALAFLGDAAVIWGALLLAYWLRFETALVEFGVQEFGSHGLAGYFGHIVVGAILLLGILTNFRFYERRNFLSFQEIHQKTHFCRNGRNQ